MKIKKQYDRNRLEGKRPHISLEKCIEPSVKVQLMMKCVHFSWERQKWGENIIMNKKCKVLYANISQFTQRRKKNDSKLSWEFDVRKYKQNKKKQFACLLKILNKLFKVEYSEYCWSTYELYKQILMKLVARFGSDSNIEPYVFALSLTLMHTWESFKIDIELTCYCFVSRSRKQKTLNRSTVALCSFSSTRCGLTFLIFFSYGMLIMCVAVYTF